MLRFSGGHGRIAPQSRVGAPLQFRPAGTVGRVPEYPPRPRIVRSHAHDCLSATEFFLVMTEVALDACKEFERSAGFVPRTGQRNSLAGRLARMSYLDGASDELPPIDLGSARIDRTLVPCLKSFHSLVHSHLGQQIPSTRVIQDCFGGAAGWAERPRCRVRCGHRALVRPNEEKNQQTQAPDGQGWRAPSLPLSR
jgi:hypothetical protein